MCLHQAPANLPSSLFVSQEQSVFLKVILPHQTRSLYRCPASRFEILVHQSVHSPTQSPDHQPCPPTRQSLARARFHLLQLVFHLPMKICEELWNLGRSEMRSSASDWCLSKIVCSLFRDFQFGFGMIYLLRRSLCRSRMIRRMELWERYWSLV